MFFDSHVHFEAIEGDDGARAIIERAAEANVDRVVAIGGSEEANALTVEIARAFPKVARAALGFDRDQAEKFSKDPEGISDKVSELGADIMDHLGRRVHIAAIGEIGLDFHYSPDTAEEQVNLFASQLLLANTLLMPVIVHSREADDIMLTALRDHADAWNGPKDRIGVVHCFTGTESFAKELLDIGFHISFSGIITFKNSDDLRKTARSIPSERILIETDSPLLAPEPFRGKRNEPANIRYVAETLAEIRGCSVEDVAQCTAANAERLFRMSR